MPIYWLGRAFAFPDPEGASEEGVVAAGGDFAPERLLLAYQSGIFPWPVEGMPLLWFSPDPRCVLVPVRAHLARSLRRRARRGTYRVTADTAFAAVIRACAEVPRPGQDGTWITAELREGYERLHRLGFAHSVETWLGDRLVGGIYGVSLGRAFFGESMFNRAPDASKVAIATLLGNLAAWRFSFLDCQVPTPHVLRLGAEEWPRRRFLRELHKAVTAPTRRGPWVLDLDPSAAMDRIPP